MKIEKFISAKITIKGNEYTLSEKELLELYLELQQMFGKVQVKQEVTIEEKRKLSDRVRALRRKMGITQAKLAEDLEVSLNMVVNWENMRGIPSRRVYSRLDRLFTAYEI